MKSINVYFNDKEFDYLQTLKDQNNADSWRKFFLELANYKGDDINDAL